MKHYLGFLLLLLVQITYAQVTHTVYVAINQPAGCLVADLDPATDFLLNVYPTPVEKSLTVFSEDAIFEVKLH